MSAVFRSLIWANLYKGCLKFSAIFDKNLNLKKFSKNITEKIGKKTFSILPLSLKAKPIKLLKITENVNENNEDLPTNHKIERFETKHGCHVFGFALHRDLEF